MNLHEKKKSEKKSSLVYVQLEIMTRHLNLITGLGAIYSPFLFTTCSQAVECFKVGDVKP